MATQVSRPDHLVLPNDHYWIKWLTEDEWQAARLGEGNAAETHSHIPAIMMRLRPEQAESRYQEILWHEITHACWDTTQLTHTVKEEVEDREEFIISCQSPIHLFVIKNNPHIIKYLSSDGKVVR